MKNHYTQQERKFLKQIGDNIRKIRTRQELSQEELAFKAGLDRSYMGGVERGERNVSAINLKKIANALNLNLSKLFNGQD